MGIREFFGMAKAKDKPQDYRMGSQYSFLFGPTSSGRNVTEFTAMQTTAVYSCVRILSEAIASLPLHLYRYTGKSKERVYDHPLYYILHDEPNPEMTSFIFRETMMTHLLLWGNAYGQITLGRDDVLHIPGLGFDGLVGYSPIAMMKNAVGITLVCEEYGASFFANGATPGGVLEHPGILKDPKKVRDSWNEVYRGSGNAHKVAVLEERLEQLFDEAGIVYAVQVFAELSACPQGSQQHPMAFLQVPVFCPAETPKLASLFFGQHQVGKIIVPAERIADTRPLICDMCFSFHKKSLLSDTLYPIGGSLTNV